MTVRYELNSKLCEEKLQNGAEKALDPNTEIWDNYWVCKNLAPKIKYQRKMKELETL